MLLGYNQKRPTEENYQDFMKILIKGLNNLDIEGLSLMVYGSFVRKEHNPGRSDIDAVMTFQDDVIIDKRNLGLAGKIVHQALKGNNIPFQVSVTDLSTMMDGRFNSYDNSFKDYFEEEGEVVVGPDYRSHFCYELPTIDEQVPVRFNLRKARTGLLFAEHDKQEDYEVFLRKFTKTLDAVSRGSKQILYMLDGKLRKNRFSGLDSIHSVFPEIDTAPLKRIKYLYGNLKKLDALYSNPDEIMDLWVDSVTFFEQMIKEYINKSVRS